MAFSLAACGGEDNTSKQDQIVSIQEQPSSIVSESAEMPSMLEISSAAEIAADVQPEGPPKVYMIPVVNPDALIAVYAALGREATGNVAVKINTGEPGSKYYLSPDLIKDFVQTVDGTIVESNTVTGYNGKRTSTAMHYQVAKDHGFTAIAPVLILDESDDMTIPVTGGKHLTENIIGAHFADFDYHIVLSHFKGKASTGFGGAITNLSMGYASSKGKGLIHDVDKSGTPMFLEAMTEAAKSVADYADDKILYINVMNNLSIDCDCRSNPAEPDMHDIGILASLDPVALDQACVDLVYEAEDGASLVARIESLNGVYTLEYAKSIGLGSREYELVNLKVNDNE